MSLPPSFDLEAVWRHRERAEEEARLRLAAAIRATAGVGQRLVDFRRRADAAARAGRAAAYLEAEVARDRTLLRRQAEELHHACVEEERCRVAWAEARRAALAVLRLRETSLD